MVNLNGVLSMIEEFFLSRDQHLLQKVVHKDTIQRVVDWKALGITKEYIDEQCKLAHGPFDKEFKFTDNRVVPDPDNQEAQDKYWVTDLCFPYNPGPDYRDLFVYYNDIRALSGTAGYLRIRDGYVWGQRVVVRS